jgi:hypothetical protein
MSPKVGGHRGLESEDHVSPLIRRRKHFDGGIEEEEKEVESLRRELAEAKMMIKKIQDFILASKPSVKKMEPRMGMGSQASKYLQETIFSRRKEEVHTSRQARPKVIRRDVPYSYVYVVYVHVCMFAYVVFFRLSVYPSRSR